VKPVQQQQRLGQQQQNHIDHHVDCCSLPSMERARLVLCSGEGDGAGGEGGEGDGGATCGEDHLSSGSAGHGGTPHGRSIGGRRSPQSCSFLSSVGPLSLFTPQTRQSSGVEFRD
jgi:hypothetical protein